MEIRYSDICSELGIDLTAPLNVIEKGKAEGWKEIESKRTIALLVAQAYIGILSLYQISESDATVNILGRDARQGSKHRQNLSNLIETVRDMAGNFNKGERPSIIGLSALGLLRILPSRNFCEADVRFRTIQIAVKDPTSRMLFMGEPELFQDRTLLAQENPLFFKENSVTERLRALSLKWKR